jgi:hypothetical protein
VIWDTLAPVLRDVVQGLCLNTPDATFKATYRDMQKPFVSPTAKLAVELTIPSSRAITTHERLTQTAGPVIELTSTLHGIREFTLNVQAKSYELSFNRWAHVVLERVRTRINRRSVRDTLLAANVACYDVGAIREMQMKQDGHALSVCSLDLFMRAGFEDEPEAGLDWIETIELTSHVSDEGGTEYEQPAGNFTNEIMPA